MDDTDAAPRTSTGKINDPGLKLQAIERLLLLTQRYITVVEVSAMQPLTCTGILKVPSPDTRSHSVHFSSIHVCRITHSDT